MTAEDPTDATDSDSGAVDAEPPILSVWVSSATTPGNLHTIILEDAERFSPAWSMDIEADCGDGWTSTMLRLDSEHAVANYFEVGDPTPVPEGELDAELDALVVSVLELTDAYVALIEPYGDYPEYACQKDPTCAEELAEIDAELAVLIAELEQASGAVDPPMHDEPVFTDPLCQFRGVYHDAADDKKFAPARFNPPYEDWDAAVTLSGDPCEGKTPKRCYAELLDKYTKRTCGEVTAAGAPIENPPAIEDLPEPEKSACTAIRSSWVDFDELSCDRLGSAGQTRRLGVAVGGGMAGSRSRVRFDWETLLRSAQSYALFMHEMDHVVRNATVADPFIELGTQKSDLSAAKLAVAQQLATAMQMHPPPSQLSALRATLVQLTSDLESVQAAVDVAILDDILIHETSALKSVLEHAAQWFTGTPVDIVSEGGFLHGRLAEINMSKRQPQHLITRLVGELARERFKDVQPSAAVAMTICGELDAVETFAKSTMLPESRETMWVCSMKETNNQLEKDFKTVRERLNCG